jgi:hypothetical protein
VVSRAHFKTIKLTQALIDQVNSLTPAGAAIRPTITLPGGRGRDDEVPNAIPPATHPNPLVTHRPAGGPSNTTAPPPPQPLPVTPSPPPPRPLTPSPPPVAPHPLVTQNLPDAAQGTERENPAPGTGPQVAQDPFTRDPNPPRSTAAPALPPEPLLPHHPPLLLRRLPRKSPNRRRGLQRPLVSPFHLRLQRPTPTKRNKNYMAGDLEEKVMQCPPLLQDDPEEGTAEVP